MKYVESITDFFKLPNFIKSLLFASVCMLIPIAGQMVVLGWLGIGFWGRRDQNFSTFPEFDFGKFGLYLQRGLWPYLVILTTILGIWVLSFIALSIPGYMITWVLGSKSILGALASFIFFILNTLFMLAAMLVLKPLKIRAMLGQDFITSFDVNFVKKFLLLTWKESLLSVLLIAIVAMILIPVGTLALCIGAIVAITLLTFATEHLDRQLYSVYVQRGGEPLPISPLLTESAPPSMENF